MCVAYKAYLDTGNNYRVMKPYLAYKALGP